MTPRPPIVPTRIGAHLAMRSPLSPLVLAILAAFPGMGDAQAVARPRVPAVSAVPRPAVGWVVSTSAAHAPSTLVNSAPNAAGGIDQTINQGSRSAIYNWQSFDIGAASSVTFNYPDSAGSSLNRVTGSTAPSAIFGRLTSQYTNPAGGAPLPGGSIYLINANGILFGNGAQVNTGALIASTLDLQNADFFSGLSQSINGYGYSFGAFPASGVTAASLLPGPNNFVLVDPGAQISTPSGGRVFLFANDVVRNAGTITTPNGQTALAAGNEVYLNLPTHETMYASEVNPAIPAVNGLLVEVGTGNGSVANVQGGVINTPTGNTTLVGMAVNQSGRINATTSVSQNGSVFLLARGGAQAATGGGVVTKEASVAGALTLGSGSGIDIEPDAALDAHGQQATSNANSAFTPSVVELEGQTIVLQSGSSVVAHGGRVDVRAETTPYYIPNGVIDPPAYRYAALTNDAARLVVDQNATIDVSGTTSTSVSAGRNFVTTALLGASDLADAPLQRTGPIYRSELTFDVRSPVPVLGSTTAYVNAIEKTANERLAVGGSIQLASTGAVVTRASSTLNVSGGVVNYTAAKVSPSELVGSNGSVYTFNTAPADLTYSAVVGASTGAQDRWGLVPVYTPSQVAGSVVTLGYVAGQAGGTLSVLSPLAILDGGVQAGVTQGVRQTAGQDALAAASRLTLGARTNGAAAFGSEGFVSAGLGNIDIEVLPGTLASSFWSDPSSPDAVLPTTSRIAASTLNASGVGQVTITSNGDITISHGANLVLPTSGSIDLAAAGAGGVDIEAGIRAAGGSVSATTHLVNGAGAAGAVTLAAGTTLDMSATWVNRALDGATAQASTAGGSVTLNSSGALDVQDASAIDVSGAATVSTAGKVAATAAGSVTLQSNLSRTADDDAPSAVHVGAQLRANSLSGGGTLTLAADTVTVGSGAIPRGVADGGAIGSLVLSNAFFDQGAFTTYRINALSGLTVTGGTAIRPQTRNWMLTPAASHMATGTAPDSFLTTGRLIDSQRAPASVVLSAHSALGNAYGGLTLAAGASIVTDPLALVTLNAGLSLNVGGTIVDPGGQVVLGLVGSAQAGSPQAGTFLLGPRSVVDVSGVAVLAPQTGLLPAGRVLAGGTVSLGTSASAAATPIVIAPGAVIAADGTSAVLGVTTTGATGGTTIAARTVASAGGTISVAATNGGVLAGTMHAYGGDASVSGGAFDLTLPATIVVQQAPVTDTSQVRGTIAVSAQSLSQNFSDATLASTGRIRFADTDTLAMTGNLTLDTPVLQAAPGAARVALSGASTLQVGSSYQEVLSGAGAIGGTASLSLTGGLVELYGHQVMQGFGQVGVASASELRLQSTTGGGAVQGDLAVQGSLTLSAPQIVPTTASTFTIDAAGQRVLLTGGNAGAAVPLSAGGAVTIDAADITTINPADASQVGVLRAPMGSLTLNATDSITIGKGSVLSVSGAGLTVPYGQTSGGTDWTYHAAPVTAAPAKSISLNAAGDTIVVATGSTLDLSGGGNLVAQEFVPGIGGSKNIFAGAAGGAFAVVPAVGAYAAQDVDILHDQPDTGKNLASLQLGRSITFGSGGPIPAGTYAVMPAQYATLAGAFLVAPTASSAPLALGAAVAQTDGSVLVGGRFVEAGTAFGSSLTQSFKVLTSAQASTYSEIDQANANAYFTARAVAKGTAVSPLPTDAGVLKIAASQLSLKGRTLFTLPTVTTVTGTSSAAVSTTTSVGRGGELDIAADNIQVGGTASSGVLSLSAADLNATGAALVVLGGQADTATGALAVTAETVVVDNAGTPLALHDLVLAANDAVTVKAGSSITAPSASATLSAAPALTLVGDGALLRVSTDAAATSVRTGVQRNAGRLSIGAGTTLSGGAVTAEGTLTNAIAGDATLSAQAITLAAGHMAAGAGAADAASADTLVLTSTLAAQVAGARSLTLRSATGLDLYGSTTLGGAAVQALTLDTGTIALMGSGATANVEAGGVTLTNTTGLSGTTATGDNVLNIRALAVGAGAGTGRVVIGPGVVAMAGAKTVAIDAAHEVVLGDTASLSTPADLSISAAALQATRGAEASLGVGGVFTLTASGTSSGTSSGTDAGTGARVAIEARAIDQLGQLVLPSGQLGLSTSQASDAAATAIRFGAGSVTDVSGRSNLIDGISVSTPGGMLNVTAPIGNVALEAGSLLDVSAPAVGANAGRLTISAPAGTVALAGSLRGTAATGQTSGALALDSAAAVDLTALAATLSQQPNNFSDSLSIRNRIGDQQLAAGTTLAARQIDLSTDAGKLTVAGTLNASGASGAGVSLAGGSALDIEAGAVIGAHSGGTSGAKVQLLSGNLQVQDDGTFAGSTGVVNFDGGTIDTRAAAGGTDGTLRIRAQRSSDGTEVAIGGTGGTHVIGTRQIEIEAVKQYAASTVDANLISQVANANLTLGATAAQVIARVDGLIDTSVTTTQQLRAGVEIDSTGDLSVPGSATTGGWNLTRFAANGSALAQASGAPMNLTLRAAGNLSVSGSISDGFMPSGTVPTTLAAASKITPAAVIAQIGDSYAQGADITLVGGADLGAVKVTATIASATQGDVTIGAAGKNVLVRSTTGDITIAAGRDVTLLNPLADVYTTGTPVTPPSDYVGNNLGITTYLRSGAVSQSPFLGGGGSLGVDAGRDIVGVDPNSTTLQYATEWAWRAIDQRTDGQPMWWNRYDQFQQGFATFGGGDVNADAGRDVVNAAFSVATSGYVKRAIDGSANGVKTYGGGGLDVEAGRDVLGGFLLGAGASASVQAGRDIAKGAAPEALQVLYGDTAWRIGALDNVDLGLVSAFGMVPATKEYTSSPLNWYLMGLTPQASLQVQAGSGDLTYDAVSPLDGSPTRLPGASTTADRVIPDIASFAAPAGSITASKLIQDPAGTTRLELLAHDNLTVSGITVDGTDVRSSKPTQLLDGSADLLDPLSIYIPGLTPLDSGVVRSPMELVAATGDVTITHGILTTTSLRLIAGRDVVMAPPLGGAFASVTIQNQAATETSLIEAGRDILLPSDGGVATGGVSFYGPGDLIMLAGRNIDLSTSGGVRALGNRQNSALPAASGDVTIESGVSLSSGDYTQAAAWYFPLLGGTGVAGYAGELVAELSALKAGQGLPAPGGAAAAQFDALSIAARITRVRALLGDAAVDAAVLADARHRAGSADVTAKQASDRFATLDADAQGGVLGTALANAWVVALTPTQRQAQALALAQSVQSPYLGTLEKFVVAQGAPAGVDAAQALTDFKDLAPERQWLLTNQVLVSVLRQSGRTASALSGAAQTAAYAPAYAALDTVFPSFGTRGDLSMGSSQVETLQGSKLTILAPRGSVDVGTLVADNSPKPASALGIVTADGGDIAIAVGDSVNVDQSRVFTVGLGDLLMWASTGSLDAGRGGKTVVGAPAPVYSLNSAGQFVIDTSGSFSGSGIAVLNAASTLDLYAPKGVINGGDAGITSLGNAFFGASAFANTTSFSVAGASSGGPPPASTGGGTAGLAAAGQSAAANTQVNPGDSEEEKERKRRKRLNLVLDFLGFGDGSTP